MTKRLGMPSKVVKNKKANIASEWNKLDRNFNNNKRLVKGPITDREIQILLRAAPKTQANLNTLKRLLTKGQISDKEARKMLLGK